MSLMRRAATIRCPRAVTIVPVLCALALASCSSLPRQIASPRVQMTSLSLLEATTEHQRFAVTLSVDNPNPFNIPVNGIEFSARLSGQGVLMGESTEPATLPATGTETLTAEVTTEIVSSFASLLRAVQGPDNAVPYEINGVLRIGSRGFERRARFSYSGQVPLSSAAGAAR